MDDPTPAAPDDLGELLAKATKYRALPWEPCIAGGGANVVPEDQMKCAAVNALPALLADRAERDAMREALKLAVPVIEAEREVMVRSYTCLSGPHKGKIADKDARRVVKRMDAALTAARALLTDKPAP